MNERKVRNWNWPWTWIRHKEWTRGASGFNVLESFSRVSPLRGALTLSKFRNARPYASSRITLPVGTCVNYACAIDAPPVKLPSSLPRLFSNPLPSPFHRSSLSTVPSIPFQQFFLPIRPKRSRVQKNRTKLNCCEIRTRIPSMFQKIRIIYYLFSRRLTVIYIFLNLL